MSSLNYSEFCRLCLVKERVSTPIFEGEGDVRRIFLKIATCLPIKVSREDHLPKSICDDCLYKVENQYQFWNTTANSEKQLHQWLGSTVGDSIDVKNINASGMDPMEMKQESMDMDQGSELSKSLSRVEAVLAEEAGRVAAAAHGEDEDEEEEESEEEGSNSEESEDDDNDADEPNKEDDDEDEAYDEELEPTTFVNVSLACDEAGPSGTQQQTSVAPSTSTSAPAASGFPLTSWLKNKKRLQAQIPENDIFPVNTEVAGFGFEFVPVKKEPCDDSLSTTIDKKSTRYKTNDLNCTHSVFQPSHNVNTQVMSTPSEMLSVQDSTAVPILKCLLQSSSTSCLQKDKLNQLTKFQVGTETTSAINQYECDFCIEAFDSAECLKLHKETHSEAQTVKVTIPNIASASGNRSVNTLLHKKKKDARIPKLYQCEVCSKQFKIHSHLKAHRAVHSSERPFKCHLCDKAFKTYATLYSHDMIHTGKKKYKCSICDYASINSAVLANHEARRHTRELSFVCDTCGKCFTSSAALKDHVVSHGERQFKCNVCEKTFHHQHRLNAHAMTHDPNRVKHLCDLCGKSYSERNHLNKHMRSHLGTNKFKCDTCGKVMTSPNSLQDHQRLHTGEKPFSCEVCSKSFSCMKVMKVHQRSHSGIKPYKCDDCGKCYTQRSSLVIHQRSHTGIKPYACEMCLKTFVTKTLLKIHEKKHDDC